MEKPEGSFWRGAPKRFMDICLSFLALLIFALPLLLIAVLVRFKLGKPVLFRQQRPGRNGRPFALLKFRTMFDATEASGKILSDDERLTDFGRTLRATSLDELPELWNVLRGDMSLVGPRPLLMDYLPYYTSEQARRHAVRPGLTGWAQVNGRNAQSWNDRLRYDLWYVDHASLGLDLRILFLTIWRVIGRHGINASESTTMTRFDDEVRAGTAIGRLPGGHE
jgi:lipopolysaccharide/colanic/teichoic acid biosynthesis glycosyltransferase